MKYKVGDKVRVRQWKAMEREFGLDCDWIDTPKFSFTLYQKEFCGKAVTISEVDGDHYHIKEDTRNLAWTDEMFEGYAFEYGDLIEVSDTKEVWAKRIYIGYVDGIDSPYLCVSQDEEDEFKFGKEFSIVKWKYARPIQKKHKIIIDEKEIELSEESYQNLKKALLED